MRTVSCSGHWKLYHTATTYLKKSLDDPKNHCGALEPNTIFKMTRSVFKHVNGCCTEGGDFAQFMRMQWERFQLTGRKNKGLCQDLLSSLDDFKDSLKKHSVGMLWREFKPCVCGWLYHSRTVAQLGAVLQLRSFSNAKTFLVVLTCDRGSWHLVGRSQRCCERNGKAQDSPHAQQRIVYLKCQWC